MNTEQTADIADGVKNGFSIRQSWDAWAKERRDHPDEWIYDVWTVLYSAVLTGCHVVFGAYPLCLALAAATPVRVWAVLLGILLGSFTVPSGGVVYVLTAAIVVLLRVAVSLTGKGYFPSVLFREGETLRVSTALIGGFVCAVYSILLYGVTLTSVLYGTAMILLSGVFCFIFVGWYVTDTTAREVLFGKSSLTDFLPNRKNANIRWQISLAITAFLLCYALRDASWFGISLGYVSAGVATLLCAKRCGAFRGMALGFLSTVGLSPTLSVSFGLAGLASGFLFPVGTVYALLGGVAAVVGWSSFAGGMTGLLSTAPEMSLSAVLSFPLLRKLSGVPAAAPRASSLPDAADMVATMALSRKHTAAVGKKLEEAVGSLSGIVRTLSQKDREDAARRQEAEDVMRLCDSCSRKEECPAEVKEKMKEALAYSALPDITPDTVACFEADEDTRAGVFADFAAKKAKKEALSYRQEAARDTALIYELFGKMMNEARRADERENLLNEPLSDKLSAVYAAHGFPDGVIKVYGERVPRLLAAGYDPDGTKITSPDLMKALSEASGLAFSSPSYFRKEGMVLMEATATGRFRLESATATRAKNKGDVSGDSVQCFPAPNGCCYLLLSDGMGTGEEAHRTSAFAVDYLSCLTGTGCSEHTSLYLLNHLLRSRGEESSATVDMFAFDMLRGEGAFYKSGAAPSYLKRGTSLFRVRSQTVSVGTMRTLDAEKIRVDVRPDDVIVMLSDGISSSPEDAPWLLSLLDKPVGSDLSTLADGILSAAVEHGTVKDDMTVLVARVLAA